mmetsp:Transcript_15743/g.36449  ORF Transcript_15743/g.36449 Transcript_15743/m.36449 type:complete len:360 (+) Transcript_15743:1214-2293(+)
MRALTACDGLDPAVRRFPDLVGARQRDVRSRTEHRVVGLRRLPALEQHHAHPRLHQSSHQTQRRDIGATLEDIIQCLSSVFIVEFKFAAFPARRYPMPHAVELLLAVAVGEQPGLWWRGLVPREEALEHHHIRSDGLKGVVAVDEVFQAEEHVLGDGGLAALNVQQPRVRRAPSSASRQEECSARRKRTLIALLKPEERLQSDGRVLVARVERREPVRVDAAVFYVLEDEPHRIVERGRSKLADDPSADGPLADDALAESDALASTALELDRSVRAFVPRDDRGELGCRFDPTRSLVVGRVEAAARPLIAKTDARLQEATGHRLRPAVLDAHERNAAGLQPHALGLLREPLVDRVVSLV